MSPLHTCALSVQYFVAVLASESGALEPCEWPPLPIALDANGKRCTTCNPPPPDRLSRRNYKIRQDCGRLVNGSDLLPGALNIAVVTLNRPVTATQPFTNAFCELNNQKTCIDAIENEDYTYYAKGINLDVDVPDCIRHWDGQYCLRNGFLRPEHVEKVHDFHAIAAAAADLCAGKYAHKFNISAISLGEEQRVYSESIGQGDTPSFEAAEYIAAWNCAMGDLACDMTYCAYTFCDLGDGSTGVYSECDGWDKVKGMPTPAKPDGILFMIASWTGIVAGVIVVCLLVVAFACQCFFRRAATDDLGLSLAGAPC